MFKPYEVKLEIVPQVTRNGTIRATIDSEVSAMMKTANSPIFELRNKVETVQKAEAVLGLKNILCIVNGFALKRSLSPEGVSMERFWVARITTDGPKWAIFDMQEFRCRERHTSRRISCDTVGVSCGTSTVRSSVLCGAQHKADQLSVAD